MNKTLTTFFCILAFLFSYACNSSDPAPTPPNTTTHKVTFDVNKPEGVSTTVTNPPSELTVIDNATALEPATPPTLDGYTFGGWYTEASTTTAFQFSTKITKATTLYAKWTKDPVVTFDTQGGNNIMSQAITGSVTMATRPDDPTREGYAFDNWYIMATGGELFAFSRTITASITVYAQWIQQFTVTYHANKPNDAPQDATVTGVSDNPVSISQGQSATAPTPPALTGYNFVAWYTEEAATNQFNFPQVITTNIDLYAKWTIQEFTVTYDANKPSGATADVAGRPNPVMINYNLRTAEPSPKPTLVGYTFEGWHTDQAVTTKFVFTTSITEDKTLYAKWVFRPSTKAELVAEINRAITPTTPSPNLNYIDTSLIKDMSRLFQNNRDFNGKISSWNVAKVANMSFMFAFATVFNGNISSWNVSKVTNMEWMFNGATAFNQNISSWNVSLVQNMNRMFSNATAFNQNISSWNVSLVQNMNRMFSNATAFNQNISSWNVSLVNNMSFMFYDTIAFNQNISNWNVAKVTDMSYMFNGAIVFNGNISNWRPTALTTMSNMFNNASAFTQNINSWNIASSVDKTDAFTGSGLASNLPTWAL